MPQTKNANKQLNNADSYNKRLFLGIAESYKQIQSNHIN